MEKHVNKQPIIQLVAGGSSIDSWVLENGEEECQIKRLVISSSEHGSEFGCQLSLGLFQKQPSSAGDFTQDTIIYTYTFRNQQLVNETTTIRVPQGWYLATLMVNNDPVNASDASAVVQVNYLSLG